MSDFAVAHYDSPYVTAYPWSSSGFGTKYANPTTLPPNTGWGVAFSPNGDALAVAHDDSPYITAYPWSSSGFGTKYTNPTTLPSDTGWGVAFSPNGDAIAVGIQSYFSVCFFVYGWSSSGFGSKFADPTTYPDFLGYGVAFRPVQPSSGSLRRPWVFCGLMGGML